MKYNQNYDLSVIVPFFNRIEFGQLILKELDKECHNLNIKIELIFVDSKSVPDLFLRLNEYILKSSLEIKVLNTKNNLAEKRNYGIINANSENIICIDDDCIPDNNFIKSHLKALNKIGNDKIILSGKVCFPKNLSTKSNFHRFRNQRHRVYDHYYQSNSNIHFHNIVAMNISFKKNTISNNNLFFDTEYNTYGLEDTQFGLDAVDKGFKLQLVDASILHMENTTIDLFIKKIHSFSKNYFFKFYEKNKEILRNQKLELNTPNILHSYLIKMASIIFYLRENYPRILQLLSLFVPYLLLPFQFFIKTFLKISDTKKKFYSYSMFKILIIITIITSMFNDKNKTKDFL